MRKIVLSLFIILFAVSLFAEKDVYRIMMMGIKIGESTDIWSEKRLPDGSCELILENSSIMKISRGSDSVQMGSDTKLAADCRTLLPKRITSTISEIGTKTEISGTNESGVFRTKMTRNGRTETNSFTLGNNITFFSLIFKKLNEAELLRGGTMKIISEESLTPSDISWTALKNGDGTLSVSVMFQGLPIKYLVSGSTVIRSEIQNGIMVYELEGSPSIQAPASAQTPDLLQNTKQFNRGIAINKPRKTKKVTFGITSANFGEIPETCFQKKAGASQITVDHTAASCIKAPENSDIMPNINEESNDPEIIKTAQKIIEGAPNKDEKIRRIAAFVHKHIKNKNYSHGNLSAAETLRAKSGDCTEHSALFAALARAAGIPTKMTYGLVMSSDGEFFFHNWNEALGDSGWIPVDATFGMVPADSSRITISYGGSDSRSREQVSLSVLRFLSDMQISVRGFANE